MGGAGQRYTDSVQDCCNFETLRQAGIAVVAACDLSGKATISQKVRRISGRRTAGYRGGAVGSVLR
jgi:hypothetical protein